MLQLNRKRKREREKLGHIDDKHSKSYTCNQVHHGKRCSSDGEVCVCVEGGGWRGCLSDIKHSKKK